MNYQSSRGGVGRVNYPEIYPTLTERFWGRGTPVYMGFPYPCRSHEETHQIKGKQR